MKRVGTIVGKTVLMLLAGAVLGTALLTLAYMLPVDLQIKEATREILESEGSYTRVTVAGWRCENHYNSFLIPDGMDNGTDILMLYTALDTNEGNPLIRAMESYSELGTGSYSYYWHGYVSVLRPLMLLFDYSEFRMVNCALQLFLVFLLVFVISREKGIRYVMMALTSYMLLMPVTLPLSLQFSWVFYVAYIGTLLLLRKRDYFAVNSRYVFFFMALGMATCYLDLLTYPLLTWGMPLVWWLVFSKNDKKEMAWVGQVVFSGIGWIIGYAGQWLMKWTLATVILRRNIFETAISEIFLRSGLLEGDGSLESRLNAMYLNWKHYEVKVYAFILAAWLIWWLCLTLRRGGWQRDSKCKAYLLIGLSSVVWYFVLANHTRGHNYFTYRIYGVSVLAFLAIVLTTVNKDGKSLPVSVWRRLALCGVFFMSAIASILLVRLAREELLVLNGTEQFQRIPVEAGGELEVPFSPTFNDVRELGLGFESAGTEGYCEVTLWEEETLRYREIFEVKDFHRNYHAVDVAWKLNHKKTYQMRIEIKDTEEPVYVWVTENGAMPLIEYGELSVNGIPQEGQLLTGLIYWCMPVSTGTRLFIAMTWMGIFLVCICGFWPKKGKTINFVN